MSLRFGYNQTLAKFVFSLNVNRVHCTWQYFFEEEKVLYLLSTVPKLSQFKIFKNQIGFLW
jgi:hypothetical protein